MGRWRVLLLSLPVACVLAATPAAAQAPRWSAPKLVSDHAYGDDIGIDRAGNVTIISRIGARLTGRARPGGESRFSAPVPLGANIEQADLEVTEDGSVYLLTTSPSGSGPGPGCERPPCADTVTFRQGPDIRRLGAPTILTSAAVFAAFDVSENGHVGVAWETAPYRNGSVEVAMKSPGRPFDGVQRVSSPGTSPIFPSAAVGERGNAVVSWSAVPDDRGAETFASYRPVGGAFGAETRLSAGPSQEPTQALPRSVVDSRGTASVAYGAESLFVRDWLPGGLLAPEQRVGPPGEGIYDLESNGSGHEVLAWGDGFEPGVTAPRTYIAARVAGGAFASETVFDVPAGFVPAMLGLDSRGNVLALLAGSPELGAGLSVALYSRLGFTRQELVPVPVAAPSGPAGLAVNERGSAVALYNEYHRDDPSGQTRAPLWIVERAADRVAPAVEVAARRKPGGIVRVGLRCNELCRVRGAIRTGRGSPAAGRSRGAVTLRRRQRGSLLLRVPPRREPAKRGGKPALFVVAEDSSANVRRVRRRLLR